MTTIVLVFLHAVVPAIAFWVLLLLAIFNAECLIATFAPLPARRLQKRSFPTLRILIPAHNESSTIGNTIDDILLTQAKEELLVVADNCSDDTADIARERGVPFIERWEPERRGKGFALGAGIEAMKTNRPDVVVILDADCRLQDGSLSELALLSWQRQLPVQCAYVIRPASRTIQQSISSFAVTVKNVVRPLGLMKLKVPCPLVGSGYAIPWHQITLLQFDDNLVEDLNMGLDLASMGFGPVFDPHTVIFSDLPSNPPAARDQRVRWEHGQIHTQWKRVPALLWQAVKTGRGELLAVALDLSVPPLSLLMVTWALITLSAWIIDSSLRLPLLTAGVLTALTLVATWRRFGTTILSLGELACAPLYAVRKLPIYLRYVKARETRWIRTKRDN